MSPSIFRPGPRKRPTNPGRPIPFQRQASAPSRFQRIGAQVMGRAASHAQVSPQRFEKGLTGLRKNMQQFRTRNDQRLWEQDARKRNDQTGLGRKGEQRMAAIEEHRAANASENPLIAAQKRMERSPHRAEMEQEIEGIQQLLEQNPNVPPEAVEEYLHSMFDQYFPARYGNEGYGTRYNNAYCARALAQALFPEHRFEEQIVKRVA
jgi:hypothetical protein